MLRNFASICNSRAETLQVLMTLGTTPLLTKIVVTTGGRMDMSIFSALSDFNLKDIYAAMVAYGSPPGLAVISSFMK
jgi:hypothetical protein